MCNPSFYVSGYARAGHIAHTGDMRNVYKILVEKHEGKIPLTRPRHRWDDNIRMDLRKQGWRVWTGFIWLRMG
jgi:hypothetical protein